MSIITGLEPHPVFGNCPTCGYALTNKGDCLNAECPCFIGGCGQCCNLCQRCTGGCGSGSDSECQCYGAFHE